jgi:pyrimidine operon attenuation protein/uracil phosphoribosyltransferase
MKATPMLELDAEAIFRTFAARARESFAGAAVRLVGVHTGGVWLAERLHAALGLETPLGLIDPAFYRDDYAKQGLAKDPKRSRIPFDVEGKDLLLVDDVLHTGRTVRAAMNELFDYGRPASIALAVLAERGGRQLPVCAQFVGAQVEVPAGMRLRLKRDALGRLSLELERGA